MSKNPETVIEEEFCDLVKELGGMIRKLKTPGHDGPPDRLVFFPKPLPAELRVWFVEIKTKDGTLESHQEREHARYREYTDNVTTLYGILDVHNFIDLIADRIRDLKHENSSARPRRSRQRHIR